jgi:hypothetical protein
MKVLHLTLKKKWFDMIASGEKKEEYREIKAFWSTRLLYKIPVPWGGFLSAWRDIIEEDYEFKAWSKFTGNAPVFEKFEAVMFRNGYRKDSPSMTFNLRLICIQDGKSEWGAEPGKKYFVIKLGERIS